MKWGAHDCLHLPSHPNLQCTSREEQGFDVALLHAQGACSDAQSGMSPTINPSGAPTSITEVAALHGGRDHRSFHSGVLSEFAYKSFSASASSGTAINAHDFAVDPFGFLRGQETHHVRNVDWIAASIERRNASNNLHVAAISPQDLSMKSHASDLHQVSAASSCDLRWAGSLSPSRETCRSQCRRGQQH